MKFQARALDANQAMVSLTVDAADAQAASRQLEAQGYALISVVRAEGGLAGLGLTRFDLFLFCQELRALLSAGLNVTEALELQQEKESSSANRAVLSQLLASVREGRRFSAALEQQPAAFPPLFVGLMRSAENTSDLPQALSRFLDYEGRLRAIRQKIVSAAIYPTILMFVGAGVATFLMGYVVPRFAAVYRSGGRPLPWASQLLLDWGSFAGAHALPLVAGLVLLAAAVTWKVRQLLLDGTWWRLLGLLPGAGPKLDALEISRLYLTMGMLLQGGMPILQTLALAKPMLTKARQAALETVAQQVAEGSALTEALVTQGLTTAVATRLLRVGERSGQLSEMLIRTATFFEEEASRWIDRFTKAFEPILMACIGVVIGLIVVLLYMPIFELAGSIQ